MLNNIERIYKIGDVVFKYIGPEFSEVDYIKIFRIDNNMAGSVDVVYEMEEKEEIQLPQELPSHQDRYMDVFLNQKEKIRVIYDDKREYILVKDICKDGFYHKIEYNPLHMTFWNSNMMMKIFDIPNQIILCNGIFLHASCVVYQGRAIVFTASKQVGKSTQASLWEKYRDAEIINGDRVLLRKIDDEWRAYGSPYAGTSRIFKNTSAPVTAIAVISQEKYNSASKLNSFESLKALMDGCSYESWNRDSVNRVVDIANELLEQIEFVKLKCLPDEGAVETLEEYLWNRTFQNT